MASPGGKTGGLRWGKQAGLLLAVTAVLTLAIALAVFRLAGGA